MQESGELTNDIFHPAPIAGVMMFTALCLTFVVFFLTNLYPNLEKLAKTQGNQRMSDEAVTSYLNKNGYLEPLPIKYAQWLGLYPGHVHTDEDGKSHSPLRDHAAWIQPRPQDTAGSCKASWGFSTVFKDDVGAIVWHSASQPRENSCSGRCF